jgi:two-component system response regulator FlrC
MRRTAELRNVSRLPSIDRGERPARERLLGCGAPAMQPVLEGVERAAANRAPILLLGEMGTGKKVTARAIHDSSDRAGAPLVLVSCRTSNVEELSCALFGAQPSAASIQSPEHTEGLAPSGAFRRARGGSLVLDGLDALPSEIQLEIVRALDEPSSAGLEELPRLIATSRVEMTDLLADGRLLPELVFHLAVLVLRLPPLRARLEDLPHLATEIARESDGQEVGLQFSGEALTLLRARRWPGNIRELANVVRRAAALADDCRILPEHLLRAPHQASPCKSLAEIERRAIIETLAAVGGHRQRAASALGIGLRTLYDKIKRYRINAPN